MGGDLGAQKGVSELEAPKARPKEEGGRGGDSLEAVVLGAGARDVWGGNKGGGGGEGGGPQWEEKRGIMRSEIWWGDGGQGTDCPFERPKQP